MLRGLHPEKAARRGVAPRVAAAGPARVAQGQRGPRPGDAARDRRAHAPPGGPEGPRRRRRPRRRPPADRHRHPRVRRPPGRRRLLPPRRQAPARVLGPAAGARGRPARPQLDRADDRPRRRRGPAAGPAPRSGPPTRSRWACSTTSSRSTTPGAASRSRCRSRRRSRGPAPGTTPTQPARGRPQEVEERHVPRPRTPNPPTSGSGVPDRRSRSCWARCRPARSPTARPPGSARWPRGCGCRCSRCERRPVMEPFDLLGPLPAGATHDRPRGERRHRQDLHARRARHPVRRRGRGDAGRDAADHVRPGRQPGAARAGPRPARRGRAGARRPRHGRRRRAARPPGQGQRRGARRSGGTACATRWPASTPPRSRPRTSSASWCCAPSAWPATPTPG